MATRNFVPRANNEGSIGTSVKHWASGFFQKLAVGAITTAVTVLTPSNDANNQQPATTGWVRSQFQSILKTVLTAAGLRYYIGQSGYICFGSLFGGLILQWGTMEWANTADSYTQPFFISFPDICYTAVATSIPSGGTRSAGTVAINNITRTEVVLGFYNNPSTLGSRRCYWIAIGA